MVAEAGCGKKVLSENWPTILYMYQFVPAGA